MNTQALQKLEIAVAADTIEQIEFLARNEGVSLAEMASRLLRAEAEARAGIVRGPVSRKHIYR